MLLILHNFGQFPCPGSGETEDPVDGSLIGNGIELINTNTGETSRNTAPIDVTYNSASAAGDGVQTDPEPLPEKVTFGVGGRNIEDIQVNAREDEQTISSSKISVGLTLPEVGSGGRSRIRQSTGTVSNLFFYRQFNSSDASTLNEIVGDGVFDAFWGFVATFYKVGSVPSATNTFQIVLACDDNYDNTGSARCVLLSFVFVQMDNIQTSDGQYIIIGAFDNSTGESLHFENDKLISIILCIKLIKLVQATAVGKKMKTATQQILIFLMSETFLFSKRKFANLFSLRKMFLASHLALFLHIFLRIMFH